MTPAEQVAGKFIAKWRDSWADVFDSWPNDKPLPHAPGVFTRIAMAEHLAALIRAERKAAFDRALAMAVREAARGHAHTMEFAECDCVECRIRALTDASGEGE